LTLQPWLLGYYIMLWSLSGLNPFAYNEKLMSYRLVILIVIGFLAHLPASGQRVFKTVNPAASNLTLVFDINMHHVGEEDFQKTPQQPGDDDLNFSPNLLFTADSSKGFVSVPGSHVVLVFNPKTGEVITTIPTGKNPSTLSMTPDGKKLAVPCLLLVENKPDPDTLLGARIGAISIIDVETHAVKTLDLTKMQFSFANNIVFSADSKTGFVASTGSDEILRFDVESATEITPRLAMPGGSGPASLTMAPDYSFFTVVLVGSRYWVRRETPETVAIIDPVNFTEKLKIDTQVPNDVLPFDFYPVNNVALSADGKFGLIAEQGFSSQNPTPLVEDRVLMFDTTTGKVVNVFGVGYRASGIYPSPDKTRFVVVSEIEIAAGLLFDGDDEDTEKDDLQISRGFPYSLAEFKFTTRPAWSADGKEIFIPMPLLDHILVVSMVTGETKRLFPAGKYKIPDYDPEKDPDNDLTAAPMELAFTPDGQVVAALNFNNTTIDLIKRTDLYSIPLFFSGTQWFTGVAITNHGTAEAELIVKGISRFGVDYQDDTSTTDVVEYKNPKTIKLAPGQQMATTAGTLLEAVAGKEIDGWLDVDSDLYTTTSFFLVGDPDVKRMDGGPAILQTATTLIMPEVRVVDGFRTEIQVLNSSYTLGGARVKLFRDTGETISETDTVDLNSLGILTGYVRDPDGTEGTLAGIFPEQSFENFTDGYLVVETSHPANGFVRYWDGQRMSVLTAFPKGTGFNEGTRLVMPQFAEFGGSESFFALLNISKDPLLITATLRNNQGEMVLSKSAVLAPGQLVRRSVAQVFELTDPGQVVSGWISVETQGPGLVGHIELRTFGGKAMTTVPLLSPDGGVLAFSHVALGLGYSTGLALINPNDQAATAQILVFDKDGNQVGSAEPTLNAGQRLIGLLPELVPQLQGVEQIGGYVRVTSSLPLIGVEMFFTENQEILSAVPAQRIRP